MTDRVGGDVLGAASESASQRKYSPKPAVVTRYLVARDAARLAQADVDRMTAVIMKVGLELGHCPDLFTFTNTDIELPFKGEISGKHSCEAESWPSTSAIMTGLEALHRTKQRVQDAWAQVPPEMRVSLHGPHDLYGGR